MNVRRDFPHAVREIENTWIPLADGTRLAARIWLPEDAEQKPVPAILEYLPYRKSDGTAIRDALRHPYFAGYGYASVRVDMRGSGESDGILYDEYLEQEQGDALEVIAWLAEQPWCSGSVGMFGKSWGGFNSLQIAARRPPALKAVIAMHFTDDRYNDDVHYMGGCLLTSQALPWASVMFAANAAPPDPRLVGERWREMWLERLEKTPPYIETWLAHQARDAYWKHGSVGEDYGTIEIPVLAVGGWSDAYNNSIPRLLAGLSGVHQGIIGPWSHNFPEEGVPGPAVGFLQESLRWWDCWLKGIDTGVREEPRLRFWMQESVPPVHFRATRAGRWVGLDEWPSPEVGENVSFLNSEGAAHTLGERPAAATRVTFRGLQRHGLESGEWGGLGNPGEAAGDQRAADGEALAFTSPPLAAPVEIVGRPRVKLTVAADQPQALLAVRLCDVAPEGASTLVSWGLLNLTHRDSHEHPTALEPGQPYTATVELNVMAYRLPTGHRWRVSVSPTQARHAWPSPAPVTLTLFCGEASRLILPVYTGGAENDLQLPFGPSEVAPPLAVEQLRVAERRQWVERDLVNGSTTFHLVNDGGAKRLVDSGMEVDSFAEEQFSIDDGQPLSAVQTVVQRLGYRREGWEVRIETHSRLTADADDFLVTNSLDAYEGNTRVFARRWTKRIPRDLM